jgi:hypothetical protein
MLRLFGDNAMTLPLWLFILLTIIGAVGSLASIAGLVIAVYVLRKERSIEQDVSMLKYEEESWHRKEKA